jgi:ABC-2 type transport system permease protein
MFVEIFLYELRLRLRQPLFYIFAVLFFLLVFGAVASDDVQIGGGIGNVDRNAPFVVVQILGMMSAIALLAVTAFCATAVNRDEEQGIQELFFSTPISASAYLLGRFAGAVTAAFATSFFMALGIIVASMMPWQDPERIQSFNVVPYLYAMGVYVLPNLFMVGAVLFAIATMTRRVLFAYIGLIGIFTLFGVSQTFVGDLDNEWMAALIDPFGFTSLNLATRYWTVAERNTLSVPLAGHLILNRVVWSVLAFGALAWTLARYRMTVGSNRPAKQCANGELPAILPKTPPPVESAAPLFSSGTARLFNFDTSLSQWLQQVQLDVRAIIFSVPFAVMLLFGVFNLCGTLLAEVGGTSSYPLTYLMLRRISGSYELILMIIIIFFSAELVWRERKHRVQELHDAMPVPDWIPLTAKLSTLTLVVAAAMVVAMVTAIIYQLINGYTHIEPFLYLKGLFLVSMSEWLLVCGLAIAVHSLSNNKYIGFLILATYWVLIDTLPGMGLNHRLYLFGSSPLFIYSDMNGYGHYAAGQFWFKIYWAFLAIALTLLANLFWARGTDNPIGARLTEAKRRLTSTTAVAMVLCTLLFCASGAWIYYNTNVLNDYRNSDRQNELTANFEKRYKQYETLAQPRLVSVDAEVAIYPSTRHVEIDADLKLVNQTDTEIDRLHILTDEMVTLAGIGVPGATLELEDTDVGYRIYRLATPLAPGAELQLRYDAAINTAGFVNNGANNEVVFNGTFLNNFQCMPTFGYNRNRELEDPDARKKHDLPPRKRTNDIDDEAARRNKLFCHDADWINFAATISTSSDQIAIAPGYLQREWEANGRRYYRYEMDQPIDNFYAFLSADYKTKLVNRQGVDISVYYDEAHPYNVDRLIEAVAASLEYYSENFSPYPYQQLRILEFPGYRRFAQSFPNTVPFSESASFVDDLRDEDDLDMVFYITAHEVAHQWWGDQMIGADVQGSELMCESLAQYSSLMVMEKHCSPHRMRKFLTYELNHYLRGRGQEMIGEMPLMLSEEQAYIHYNKGSLVMYCLRQYIGEETLNAALRSYLAMTVDQGPPYSTSREFVEVLREATPQKYQYLITDMFETITLYDNRLESAICESAEDGNYTVRLSIDSHKMRADSLGAETELAFSDWIEIGIYGEAGEGDEEESILYLEKHLISSGQSELEISVPHRPTTVGIDPRHLLIDRVPDDNLRNVSS